MVETLRFAEGTIHFDMCLLHTPNDMVYSLPGPDP